MALNFRLAYKKGYDYTDLFPATSLNAIIDSSTGIKYSTIDVTIPQTNEETQNITITTTPEQVNAGVRMFLNTVGEQAQNDYNTITQYFVTTNQLTITRLNDKPTGSIDVTLLFIEQVAE